MADNPFDQFDSDKPAAPNSGGTVNPFDQFGGGQAAPAEPVTYRGKNLKGEDITFQAPAGTDQATIKQMAIKAIGEPRYANATIFPPDNGVAPITPKPSDDSILRAIALGAWKPFDKAGEWLGDAFPSLDHLGTSLGFPSSHQASGYEQAQRDNNSRTGYQTLGGIAATAPIVAASGGSALGLLAGGATSGALLTNSHDLQGTTRDALLGAGGSLIGGKVVAPILGAIARPVISGAARYLNGLGSGARGAVDNTASNLSSRAGSILLKTLTAQGQTPQEALSIIQQAQNRGVPLALMDTGDETRGLASALGRDPGEARTTIRDAVVPRQDSQVDRISSAVRRDLGNTTNVREQSEQMIADARNASTPLYDRAYSNSVPTTPELESLLQTPAGRAAISRAHVIAANERRAPSELGFALDENGQTVLNPAPNQQIADHLAAKDNLKQATDAYTAAQATTGANTSGSMARLTAAREGMQSAENGLSAAPNPEQALSAPTYTTQTLDYVKRGLDDVIEQHRDPVTGRLVLDEAGRAINGVRSNFLKEVDRLNPDYAVARSAYAGPAAMTNALNKGAKIGAKDAETIAAETRDLTGPELDQYRLGVRSALVKQLESRTDASDKVRVLVGSPQKRNALSQLFGGEDQFSHFMDTLADESRAAATHARVNTGSSTAANLADDGNLGGVTGIAAKAGIRAISGTGFAHNALATLGDVYRYGAGEAGARTRAELARTISNTDPGGLDALVRLSNAPPSPSPNAQYAARLLQRMSPLSGAAVTPSIHAGQQHTP